MQHLQFGELQKEVAQLTAQNRKKFETILQAKPHFSYQLVKVNENRSVSLNFGKELLMKQIDKLMEEENYLNRELSMINFEDEEK